MNRRDFLTRGSAAAVALSSGFFIAPNPANAFSLGAVSAAFSLASGIGGFLSRGSNPTVPLLISLSQAVEALNIKIDAIDQKLDLMLAELFEIRQLVENLPYENQLLGLGIDMREPYSSFLELKPETQVESPSEAYLRAIPGIRDRMRTTRIRYLDLALQHRAPAFEAVLQLALAQDAELILAAEMQRPEMYSLGLEEDIKATLGALEAYAAFFNAAVDPDVPGSITSVKAALALDVGGRLGENVQLAWSAPIDAWGAATTPRAATVREIFGTGSASAMCGDDGGALCLQYGDRFRGGCAEPGFRRHFNTEINVARTAIPQTVADVNDTLGYPYLHEVSSDLQCGTLGEISGIEALTKIQRSANDINAAIVRYYKVHYAHGVCELAQEINSRQQRILRDLIGI